MTKPRPGGSVNEAMLYTAAVINFDHNATSPMVAPVVAGMVEAMEASPRLGNPSSVHGIGRKSRNLIETARRRIADALGAQALEVTFTSGGTESDNLAILGVGRALRRRSPNQAGVLTSPLEHPAVLAATSRLAAEGHRVAVVAPDASGRIGEDNVLEALDAGSGTIGLVSLAAANHELGNAYDIPAIAQAIRENFPGVLIHCDAVQAFGKIPVDYRAWDVDLLSVSAHKVGGPMGVGALVHRKGIGLDPGSAGGHQERGRRVGTEPLWAIHGFGIAAAAVRERIAAGAEIRELRAALAKGLRGLGARIWGDADREIGNTVSAGFAGCPGELTCMNLDLEGVAVSTGAACSVGSLEPSPVLLALGLTPAQARSTVRFSLGPGNTRAEVDAVLRCLPPVLARIRAAEQEAS